MFIEEKGEGRREKGERKNGRRENGERRTENGRTERAEKNEKNIKHRVILWQLIIRRHF